MLSIGDVVGGVYRIERLLGQGGMAHVFLVSHIRLDGKKFALKLISQPAASATFLQRFKREADVLGKLSHAHIVNIIDFNQTPDGMPYLVMECLEGEDLSHFLGRTGSLQKEVALSIIYQAGQALQSAHDAGVIHRDLKPGNLFVCKNQAFPNYIKVLDFGIAKILNENGLTSDRSLMGTPAYMSPEQASGMVRQIDYRSDQFSLAVILYELLSGRNPFCPSPEADPIAILGQVITAEPAPLPFPSIWPALERALRKKPEQRFPSIHAFVEATGARQAFGAIAKPLTMGTNTNGEVAHSVGGARSVRTVIRVVGVASALVASFFVVRQIIQPALRPMPTPTTNTRPQGLAPAIKTTEPDALGKESARTTVRPPKEQAETARAHDDEISHEARGVNRSESSVEAGKPMAPLIQKPAGERRSSGATELSAAKSKLADQLKQAPTSSSSGSTSSGFSIAISGANEEQTSLIKACANKELKALSGMPKLYKINLQRSGALHIIDSPPQVFHTELTQCLRSRFQGHATPEAVVLTVRGSR